MKRDERNKDSIENWKSTKRRDAEKKREKERREKKKQKLDHVKKHVRGNEDWISWCLLYCPSWSEKEELIDNGFRLKVDTNVVVTAESHPAIDLRYFHLKSSYLLFFETNINSYTHTYSLIDFIIQQLDEHCADDW